MIINVPPQARSTPQILNVKNKLMSPRRYIFTFLLSVLSALTLSAQNHNFEVAKNLDIFNTLYRGKGVKVFVFGRLVEEHGQVKAQAVCKVELG